MSITLTKASLGQKVNLSKSTDEGGEGVLKNVLLGLEWNVNPSAGGANFDADVSVVFSDSEDKSSSEGILFYNTPDPSTEKPYLAGQIIKLGDFAEHTGDNQTGEDEVDSAGNVIDKDDEAVIIHLDKVPEKWVKAHIYVTIHKAEERSQNFGMLNDSFIRIVNNDTGSVITKFDLDFDADQSTSVKFGTLIKRDNDWYFSAEKVAVEKGLQGIVEKHQIS